MYSSEKLVFFLSNLNDFSDVVFDILSASVVNFSELRPGEERGVDNNLIFIFYKLFIDGSLKVVVKL